jgi:hypothetical protein
MAEKMDVLAATFSRYLTGFALSKALLEDYVKVVAKLENVPEAEVKDRVWKRTDEIFKETLEKQRNETAEAS